MNPLKVFVSYAHKDARHLEDLREHLSGNVRNRTFEIWSDREIPPGRDWEREILQKLEGVDLVLVLLSPAFTDSEYCMTEAGLALKNLPPGRVIPILIRHVDWESSPFVGLQMLPGGEPVPDSGPLRDAAFAEISRRLRELAAALREERQGSQAALIPAGSLDEPERLNERAFKLAEHGDPEGAIEMLDQALTLCRQRDGEASDDIATLLANRGQAFQDLGQLEKAREDQREAIAITEALHGRHHAKMALYLANLGNVLLEMEEGPEALRILEEASRILASSPADEWLSTRVRILLAGALGLTGDFKQAKALLKEVMKQQPPDSKLTASAYSALGRLACQQGDLRTARACFTKASNTNAAAYGHGHPFVALDRYNLALVLRELRNRQAEGLLRQAVDVLSETLGIGSPRVQWARTELAGHVRDPS